jgi:hypothetical protein
MPANNKQPHNRLTMNDMRSYESILYAEALKDAKIKRPSKCLTKPKTGAPRMPSSRAAVHAHLRISHKRLIELYEEYRRKRYKYICPVTHSKKKGHRQTYSLFATKEWWSPSLEYFYRTAQQARRNERRRLLRKMRKESESST